MSEIDVMYTRTYNGDYLADFDCNADDLPKSNVFFYKAIQADELAALRSRIAELEANIIECDAMTNLDRKPRGIDEAEVAIVRMASEGREAMDRLAELEAQSATLTPRQCNRACFERGWQAAIDAAAGYADTQERWAYNKSIEEKSDRANHKAYRIAQQDTAGLIAQRIRSLQPPAECGDCNPLKPSESDAAMLDEWHKRM